MKPKMINPLNVLLVKDATANIVSVIAANIDNKQKRDELIGRATTLLYDTNIAFGVPAERISPIQDQISTTISICEQVRADLGKTDTTENTDTPDESWPELVTETAQ